MCGTKDPQITNHFHTHNFTAYYSFNGSIFVFLVKCASTQIWQIYQSKTLGGVRQNDIDNIQAVDPLAQQWPTHNA